MIGGTLVIAACVSTNCLDLLSDSLRSISDKIGEACEDDGCELLYYEIRKVLGVVKKRYWDLVLDKNDLFVNRPTGRMSWKGHVQQLKQWQGTLRNLLFQANSSGCLDYPSDAWSWATRPAPKQPAR